MSGFTGINPPKSRLSLYGVTYEIDLELCRTHLLARVAALGAGRKRGGMELVAREAGVSRRTLRVFLEGGRVSVESFVSIITRGLLLDVAAVAKVANQEVAA